MKKAPAKKKKMLVNFSSQNPLSLTYIPATLKENAGNWQIEYYCLNPYSDRLERIRLRVNKLRKQFGTDTNARRELKKLCVNINLKLLSGWSPFVDVSSVSFKSIVDLCEDFLVMKKKEVRGETSIQHYNSQITMFKTWLMDNNYSKMLPCDFSKSYALKYMDYISTERNVINRTWNNYRAFLRSFFNWMIEREYCSTNSFSEIKPKRNEEKKRVTIPIEDRKRIVSYLKKHDYPFFIFTLLEFSCLMRPIEIFRMTIGDINIDKQIISLKAKQTKNGNSRNIVIPDNVVVEFKKYLDSVHIDRYDKSCYLFSTSYRPGKKMQTSRVSGRSWSNLRTALKLPMEYQLYSLRDSFITDMINSNVSPLTVQQHADHSSLAMTSLYANKKSSQVDKQIKENSPNFY